MSRDDSKAQGARVAPILPCTLTHQQSELCRGGRQATWPQEDGPRDINGQVRSQAECGFCLKDGGWYVGKVRGEVGQSTRGQCSQWPGFGPGGNKVYVLRLYHETVQPEGWVKRKGGGFLGWLWVRATCRSAGQTLGMKT